MHIGSFAIYNALIGYLLRESSEHGFVQCLLLSVALAFHFLASDRALRRHNPRAYDDYGRWLIAAAIVVGWLAASFHLVGQMTIAMVWAFTGGGIILNVLKEELPDERESCFWSFSVGALIYAVPLLLIGQH